MLRDLSERAARTFVQAFVATLLIVAPVTDLSTARTAAAAAFAAGISAVLSLLASALPPHHGSASLDPRNAGTGTVTAVRPEHRR